MRIQSENHAEADNNSVGKAVPKKAPIKNVDNCYQREKNNKKKGAKKPRNNICFFYASKINS